MHTIWVCIQEVSRGPPVVLLLPTRAITISGQRRDVFGGHLLIPARSKTPIKPVGRSARMLASLAKFPLVAYRQRTGTASTLAGLKHQSFHLSCMHIENAYVCDQRRNR